jgi:hypothetical protein
VTDFAVVRGQKGRLFLLRVRAAGFGQYGHSLRCNERLLSEVERALVNRKPTSIYEYTPKAGDQS